MDAKDLKIGILVITGGYMGVVVKTDPATVFLGNGLRQEVEVEALNAVGFIIGNTVAASGGIADFHEILGYGVYEQVLGLIRNKFESAENSQDAPVQDTLADIREGITTLMEKSQWTVPDWFKLDGV